MTQQKEKTSVSHKILTVVGIVMCVILIPILIINCTLLVKGYTKSGEVPTLAGIAPMIVLTDSMEGAFNGGDLIFIRTAEPEEIEVGDVISFFDPAGSGTAVVTHRVMEILQADGALKFVTKGDANNAEDRIAVPESSLIGTYTGFHIPGAGSVAMFMQTTAGLIVCVILPVLLLVGYDILRRRSYEKKHAQDKDALLAELEELRRLKSQSEELRVESGENSEEVGVRSEE